MFLSVFSAVVLIPSLIISCIVYIVHKIRYRSTFNVRDKTVFIVGGSSGIGLCLAMEAIKMGAKRIYIAARTRTTLEEAKEKIWEHKINDEQEVLIVECDVTDLEQVKKVKEMLVNDPQYKCKSLDFVFINQGKAEPGYLLESDENIYKRMMEINYLGSVYMTKALLPIMLHLQDTSPDSKHLVLVSSAAGILPMIGYTSYCPAKFAVRAFAECLYAELDGERVQVHCAIPVDVDTPGYHKENETKPPETLKLSEVGGMQTAESTAKVMWDGMRRGHFILVNDISISFLYSATRGMAANFTFLQLDWLISCLTQFFLPVVRLYFWFVPYRMREARRKRFISAVQHEMGVGN